MRKYARKQKTRTMNKILVVDLLKENGRITGAVGFNLIDGNYFIFKAKAIVLANGDCQFKGMRMWRGSGDGVMTAFMSGAEMRNAEFGNFYEMLRPDNNEAMPFAHHFLYNNEGEFITPVAVNKNLVRRADLFIHCRAARIGHVQKQIRLASFFQSSFEAGN